MQAEALVRLGREPFQNFFSEFLRLAKELLIFDKQAVQFDRLIGRKLAAQQHVTDVHWIRQGSVFVQFFERGGGIVVVHPDIVVVCCFLVEKERDPFLCCSGP